MNNEKTILDNEKTQYDNEKTQQATSTVSTQGKAAESKNQPTWKTVAVGAGTGILLGASATLFSSATPAAAQENASEGNSTSAGSQQSHEAWNDGQIQTATSVSDDMSFGQAFAAARAEVGSGGVFEWRGNIYSTYTAEEWNAMTPEQRNEYGSHFSYHSNNHGSHHGSHDTAQQSHDNNDTSHDTAQNDHQHGSNDEVEVVATDQNGTHTAQQTTHQTDDILVTPANDEVAVVGAETGDVEILGVVHDQETGANVGGMVIDGQEFVVIDVDGDGQFDLMGADLDGNGQLAQNEVIDISGQNLTVNDLGGIHTPDGSLYASNDEGPDYINDADVNGYA